MTPDERIDAEHRAFIAWRAPAGLESYQRELMNADRRGTALARLVGTLRGLARAGELPGDVVAEAVEESLRIRDEDLVFGRTSEPKPLPEFEAVSAR